jgi:hypothetical protein
MKPTARRLRGDVCRSAEGSLTAPILIEDDGSNVHSLRNPVVVSETGTRLDSDLMRAFTPLSIDDDHVDAILPLSLLSTPAFGGEQHRLARSDSSQSIIEADSNDNDEEIECKYPLKQCLVKPRRYRIFRASIYKLFAITTPDTKQLPFNMVIKTVNKSLVVEQQFSTVEAKRILKFMKDKLLDSLCADRVTGVNLEEVKLYA